MSHSILRAVCREQVLLERGSLLAYRLATAHESTERQQWLNKLSSTVNEMEATYRALAEGGPESQLPANPPTPVRAIYFEPPFYLDRQMRQYIEDARKIINAPDAELNESNPHLAALRKGPAEKLAAGFEAVARQYQQRDEAGVKFLQQ